MAYILHKQCDVMRTWVSLFCYFLLLCWYCATKSIQYIVLNYVNMYDMYRNYIKLGKFNKKYLTKYTIYI